MTKLYFIAAGFGWLTIQIVHIYAHGEADGSRCDTGGGLCDPYIKLFLNGKNVLQTLSTEDRCCFNPNVIYTSDKISKSSRIKIELWDDDSGFLGSADDLILRTEGNIDSFLRNGVREGAVVRDLFVSYTNSIVTISFWKDEYVDL